MKIGYFVFRVLAKGLSKIPFPILHGIADMAYFFVYHVFAYRRDVVKQNLRNSFPEKTGAELTEIEKKYYHHLCDLLVEVMKVPGMTREDFLGRINFKNPEVLDELHKKNKSVFIATGHFGNWEWTGSLLGIKCGTYGCGIYKPLSNPFFDEFMRRKIRGHFFPIDMIPFKEVYRKLYRRKEEELSVVIASDQTPTASEINYWTNFLNQETGFFLGIEKMSKSLDYAVVYLNTRKVGRSRYEVELDLITENPKSTEMYEITDQYIQSLEKSIVNQPENWLWSHKRWKHKNNSNNKP